jgi:tRNA threonylcarbamoyladenosine biosynthesis protein TsaB
MATTLIIETSTEICSLALVHNNRVIDSIESNDGQNHARLVTVFAETLLKRNQIKVSDLQAVAVSKGPGSYTGLRIGVSAAKGICYACQIPLIAIGTLEAMSSHVSANLHKYNIADNRPILFCPMIDARRMEVFSMVIDQAGNIVKPISANIIGESFMSDELNDFQVVFFGNGSGKCKNVITSEHAVFIDKIEASATHMAELSWLAYQAHQFENIAYFEPYYLKDFIVTVSKKKMF